MRDANTKGGSLESGTCHKKKIGSPDLGQDTVGGMSKPEGKSKPNPSTSAPRGHTIK